MDDILPTDFDLIVIGTGLAESIVAAAASRIGKSVLHIDSNDYYGGQWASFNLENIQKLSNENQQNLLISNVEIKWAPQIDIPLVENLSVDKTISEDKPDENEATTDEKELVIWSQEKLLSNSRKFNIDITPKLLFARGDLVELLISSNICRYAEFRAVDKVLTILNEKIKSVPSSRSDVFNSNDISIIEKRLLMKVLANCMNSNENDDDFKEFEMKTFKEYLQSKKLTPNLIHYIIYAISMTNENTMCIDGIKNTKKFLQSLGRYGNTAFLFPMYGCGEISQCFCRLCAVFGGVYCLNRSIDTIKVNNETKLFDSIDCGGQTINGKALVIGNGGKIGKLVDDIAQYDQNESEKSAIDGEQCGLISRAILILSKPIGGDDLNAGGGGVNFLRLTDNDEEAFVIQLSYHSGTCPKDLYLIHIMCRSTEKTPKEDVEPFFQQIFNETNLGTILWSMYFNLSSCKKCSKLDKRTLDNIHFACVPFHELDYDKSIQQAKLIFAKIYPDDEFLPRAPDPEEIIIEGDTVDDKRVEIPENDELVEENKDEVKSDATE